LTDVNRNLLLFSYSDLSPYMWSYCTQVLFLSPFFVCVVAQKEKWLARVRKGKGMDM
jgi:hypothetical protein